MSSGGYFFSLIIPSSAFDPNVTVAFVLILQMQFQNGRIIQPLLVITSLNGGLRSREMVTCCLSSARYFSLPLMLPRVFFPAHREFNCIGGLWWKLCSEFNCAASTYCTWHLLHMALTVYDIYCAWHLLNVALTAHGTYCTWHLLHMALTAHSTYYMWHLLHTAVPAHGTYRA
jgi:hypothetical protein